jgi:hypothetical protein
MSVKSRIDKINQAQKTTIILNKSSEGLNGIIEGNQKTQQWSFKRLNNQTIKFGKREVTAIVYQTDCQYWNEVSGTLKCKGNLHNHTCCYHIIAAYQEAMWLAGYIVYKTDNGNHARKLMNFGCSFVKLLSNGGGTVTLAIKRNGTTQRQAFDNLKQLLGEKRIGLNKSGYTMPIAYKVELYRRSDGKLAFKSGSITSKPVAHFGRDWESQSGAYVGQWKLTDEAERNWQEFIDKVVPNENFSERVNALRGEVEEGID